MGGYFSSSYDRPLEQESFLPPFVYTGLAFVEQNGWFILFGAILLFLIWKKVAPSLNATYESWQEGTSNMDPAVVQKREEALLAARERMQTLAARNSIIAEERRREVEEEKQRTKAEEWEHHRMFGEGLNNKSSQVDQKPSDDEKGPSPRRRPKYQSRPDDYSPLMGPGGGTGYRPARKAPRGGGG